MKCYTNSLNDHPVNLEKVRGCLGKQIFIIFSNFINFANFQVEILKNLIRQKLNKYLKL